MQFRPIWICLLFSYVLGNTEKAIFLGPPPVDLAAAQPSVDFSGLKALDHVNSMIRTRLEADSPISALRGGNPSWFVLHNLTESQRYEVRVCWAATQPTTFKLEVYELKTIFSAPKLLTELSEYAASLHRDFSDDALSPHALTLEKQSILLLRILTTADFYTKDLTLMGNAPPVPVDIIMDPFILNVLPRSLTPTVAYIAVVVVGSWFIANWVSSWVCQTATIRRSEKKFQ